MKKIIFYKIDNVNVISNKHFFYKIFKNQIFFFILKKFTLWKCFIGLESNVDCHKQGITRRLR